MKGIEIKVIPHDKQRYETVGDWFYNDSILCIRVSDMGNWKYEMAVALHELIEVLICKSKGITQKACDDFDMKYEDDRAIGKYTSDQEPGDDPHSPYHMEHSLATAVERMFIFSVGESWAAYNAKVSSM